MKKSKQQHFAQTLYHMAKALDETRLVIENDGWEHCCTQLTDPFLEENDLLYADRRPKVDPAVIRAILAEGLAARKIS